jgi:starch phosphorylase
MVKEYVQRLYLPAADFAGRLSADGNAPARELAAWKARVRAAWPGVAVRHVESGGVDAVPQVGDELHLRAHVTLGGLSSQDVTVEVVYGRSSDGDGLEDVRRAALEPTTEPEDDGVIAYAGSVSLDRAGSFGYTVRIVPRNSLLVSPAELGLVAVAS